MPRVTGSRGVERGLRTPGTLSQRPNSLTPLDRSTQNNIPGYWERASQDSVSLPVPEHRRQHNHQCYPLFWAALKINRPQTQEEREHSLKLFQAKSHKQRQQSEKIPGYNSSGSSSTSLGNSKPLTIRSIRSKALLVQITSQRCLVSNAWKGG